MCQNFFTVLVGFVRLEAGCLVWDTQPGDGRASPWIQGLCKNHLDWALESFVPDALVRRRQVNGFRIYLGIRAHTGPSHGPNSPRDIIASLVALRDLAWLVVERTHSCELDPSCRAHLPSEYITPPAPQNPDRPLNLDGAVRLAFCAAGPWQFSSPWALAWEPLAI